MHPITATLTFSESGERIVENVKMDGFPESNLMVIGSERPSGGIVVSNQIGITYEDGDGRLGGHGRRRQEA